MQPVHIHKGACPDVGDVVYDLSLLVDGKATKTLPIRLADLLTGGFSINLHKSVPEINVYTACGNIPKM